MKSHKWTLCLAAAGVLSLSQGMHAEEAAAPSNLLTALSSTTLSGYVSFSAVWNPAKKDGPIAGMAQSVGGTQYQDGFNLDVVSLTLDRPLTDDQWSAGYHVQMLMGPGAAQRGSFLSGQATSDFGFNEAYIDVKVPVGNGIEFDFGQIGTYNGYEAYDVYKNPNFTKSYGFYNETSAHTGVRATYKFNDMVTFSGAVGNTGSAVDGGSSRVDSRAFYQTKKAYLGMLTLTAPESFGFLKGGSISLGALDGPANNVGFFAGGSHHDSQQLYAGASIPTPVKDLAFGVGYDYTAIPAGALAVGPAYANSIAGYMTYGGIENLKLNTRVDYGSSTAGWYYFGAKRQRIMSVTETVDYSIWKNVISRAEVRYDTSLVGGEHPYGAAGEYKNSVLFALNLIYQF